MYILISILPLLAILLLFKNNIKLFIQINKFKKEVKTTEELLHYLSVIYQTSYNADNRTKAKFYLNNTHLIENKKASVNNIIIQEFKNNIMK